MITVTTVSNCWKRDKLMLLTLQCFVKNDMDIYYTTIILIQWETFIYDTWQACLPKRYLRDRPFNLQGGRGYVEVFFVQKFFFGQHKTLNQIFFFLHQNQNIFFSSIGNQNIFFRKKNRNTPLEVKWSVPNTIQIITICAPIIISLMLPYIFVPISYQDLDLSTSLYRCHFCV